MPRASPLLLPLSLLSAIALVGCTNDGTAPASHEAAGEPSTPTPPDVGALVVDSKDPHAQFMAATKPGIPAAYKDISFGMSRAEVSQHHPEMNDDLIRHKAQSDIFFHLDFGLHDERLERLYFSMPSTGAHELCRRAWGPGLPIKAATGEADEARDHDAHKKPGKEPSLRWFNAEDGLRATLSPGFGDEWDIELTAYTPFERLLGVQDRQLVFERGGALIGKTIEELRTIYGPDFVEISTATAHEAHEHSGLGAGASLAHAGAHSYLHMPPTEWGDTETRVRLHINKKGVVVGLGLSIVYAPNPAAKGAIRSFVQGMLGEGELTKDLLGDMTLRFEGEPTYELSDDEPGGAWDLRVSQY